MYHLKICEEDIYNGCMFFYVYVGFYVLWNKLSLNWINLRTKIKSILRTPKIESFCSMIYGITL